MEKKQLIKNSLKYQFKNEVEEEKHILTLSGFVGEPDLFDMIMGVETISPQDVRNVLDDVDKDIHVKINSGGGDVFAGIEIYNYLKGHSSNVTIEVTALAGSAASIIAMAGDKIVMDTGSSMMIHEAATIAIGTKSEIQKTMNALETIDGSLIDIYAERTGLSADELSKLIVAETWLTADEAVEKGFADEKSTKQAETVETPEKDNEKVVALESKIASLEEKISALSDDKVVAKNTRRYY